MPCGATRLVDNCPGTWNGRGFGICEWIAKKVRRIGSIGAPDAHLEVTSMSGRWVPATRFAFAFNAGFLHYSTAFCANLFIIGAGIVKSYMPPHALSLRRMLCAQQTEQQRHAG